MTLNLYYRHLNDDVPAFHRAHPSDAGLDLHSTEDLPLGIGQRGLVRTGVAVAIPEGCVGLVCSRSGFVLKRGLAVANAPGIIDSGYRGEVKVLLHNIGPDTAKVGRGDRIAQLVIVPLVKVLPVATDILPEGDRGTAGFGSTGETTVTGVPVGAKSLAEAEAAAEGPKDSRRSGVGERHLHLRRLVEKLAPIPPPPDDHPHGYYEKTPEGYVRRHWGKFGATITTLLPDLPDHADPDAPELIHLSDGGLEMFSTPDVPTPDPADADPLILESVSWPGGEATLPEGVPMTDSSVAEALRDLADWITKDHSPEGDN